MRSLLALAGFVALALAVGVVGSLATIANVDGWYATADKAPWNPPNGIFGPVWTLLYALMGIAAWLVWRRRASPDQAVRGDARSALRLYLVQLAINAVWTPVFFALYPTIGVAALWLALAIIVALAVAIPVTMLAFARVDRRAAWLLLPYWLWVLFATTLNLAVAVLQT